MIRAIPWIISTVLLVAFAASFLELQRMRTRFSEVTRYNHEHSAVREFMIGTALADAQQPIVILGDSITEMAPLPRFICGHLVINAGIGGMNIRTTRQVASRLFHDYRAFQIVIAIGGNDSGSAALPQETAELIRTVAASSTRPLIVTAVGPDIETNRKIADASSAQGVMFVDSTVPPNLKMSDAIHYTAGAYAIWIPAIEGAINKQCN